MARLTWNAVQKWADYWEVRIEESGTRQWDVWHSDVQGITGVCKSLEQVWQEVCEFAELAGHDVKSDMGW